MGKEVQVQGHISHGGGGGGGVEDIDGNGGEVAGAVLVEDVWAAGGGGGKGGRENSVLEWWREWVCGVVAGWVLSAGAAQVLQAL